MIEDKLNVLALGGIGHIKQENMREDVARLILDHKAAIENNFTNNEYLKIDLTNGEILGLKSHGMLGNMLIGDLPAMNYVIARDDKYKSANIINLGNVNDLYKRVSP